MNTADHDARKSVDSRKPLEKALDAAILAHFTPDGESWYLSELVGRFRGTFTGAELRRSVDRLMEAGQLELDAGSRLADIRLRRVRREVEP